MLKDVENPVGLKEIRKMIREQLEKEGLPSPWFDRGPIGARSYQMNMLWKSYVETQGFNNLHHAEFVFMIFYAVLC